MSSYTTILCYAIDSQLLSQLLNQPDSAALVEVLRAAGKQTTGAKKKFEKELELHLPFLEKIMAGIPAIDGDPFGADDEDEDDDLDEDQPDDDEDSDDEDSDDEDWDDDEPFESEQYLDAFEWLFDRLGKPIPIPEGLYVDSIVGYHYYGFTEALKRFKSPFPLPIFDDAGMLTGFIPHEQLQDFKFKPIDPALAAEIQEALTELKSMSDDDDENEPNKGDVDHEAESDEDDDMDLVSFMANRASRDFAAPEQAEIELAHEELAAVFNDIHQLGKDFIGIIRHVG